jgi:hypothetical protein
MGIGFDSGYDFDLKKFTTTNINFSWDLHCWEFSFSWVPFGDRKSYMAQLNIKSPLLQDLKIQQRGRLGRTDESLILKTPSPSHEVALHPSLAEATCQQ